jgi:hypothetical protein
MIESKFTFALPLLQSSARVADALHEATTFGADAIVSTDGKGFQAYGVELLQEAARQFGPDRTVGTVEGMRLELLDTARAAAFGLDYTAPKADLVTKAMEALHATGLITSIASLPADRRGVLVMFHPDRIYQEMVRRVYVCPVDQQPFPGPGVCTKHNRTLVRRP